MDRIQFTVNIVTLLKQMIDMGEKPIIDFCKRSDEEQFRLFMIGRDSSGNKIGKTVTDCDGKVKVSAHQRGKAMDILFLNGNNVVDPKLGWSHWHDVWESWGGRQRIQWDLNHFEG